MNFAGTPLIIVFGGTSVVTTAPAATIEFSPTVTPGSIVAPTPIQAPFFITMGKEIVALLSAGFIG